ncbi:MAG TPA: fumarylacetoacetate hydrolase family protein [Synergistaceae bacterium]|nr:fumarylacetoacetate hydrolase family protein [Synergistaceae bacterium]HPQ38293.1 fumarylacetoacetate hydrolase family protein [Synergistaceae bacterium]
MKIVRVAVPGETSSLWGILEEGEVRITSGMGGEVVGSSYAEKDVKLLAPAEPSKIVCVGRNYLEHIHELGNEIPKNLGLFLKTPNALADPGEAVPYPFYSENFHYEGELALVMGKVARNVSKEHALDYVLGYTVGIDFTARDVQRQDLQWVRAKAADKFCPLGPWIETELDPFDLQVKTTVNGEVRQDGRTSLMMYPVDYIVSYISEFMTLLPGDVILTGTPKGVGSLERGDRIDAWVEGIGTLTAEVC